MSDYILTKIDLAAMKQADFLSIRLDGETGLVRAIKERKKTDKEPFAHDIEHVIEAPVRDYKRVYGVTNSARKYRELIWLYPGQHCHVSSIIKLLRVGDKIEFEFYPDYHTNGYSKDARLHGDMLRLQVERGKERFTFNLQASIAPENSARMCQGTNPEYVLA